MLAPAAKFQKEDLYTKKYWRRIQNLAKSSGTDDGKKKYFFLTGMSKMAFAILFYYRWMHIKIISLWLWISVCPDKDVVWKVQLLVGSRNGTKTVLDRP